MPDDLEEMWHTIEPLSKQDLRREHVRLISVSGDPREWRRVRTTGTTGEPVEMILDVAAQRAETSALARLLDGINAGWHQADLFHLVLHAGAASRSMPSPLDPRRGATKWNLLPLWQQPDYVLLEKLQCLNGTVVTTLPSVLECLIERIARIDGRNPRPVAIVVSGEHVEPRVRDRGADIFGCAVTAAYSLTEAGIAGTACDERDAYHVDEDSVYLEILDGEIVVTPLHNYAMPLLRYRTGDRGTWLGPCSCGRTSPRFRVDRGRRPSHLIGQSDMVDVVRFAKLFAGLDVDRIQLAQPRAGSVIVDYDARAALAPDARGLIAAALRTALGPEIDIGFRRGVAKPGQPGETGLRKGVVEPASFEAADVARWLSQRLVAEPGIDAAVLTGSALDVQAMTRLSDIDVVLLVQDPESPRWVERARSLRRWLARLSVNVDLARDLSRRAPVLACRLRAEQLPILGRIDQDLVPWPTREALAADARLRMQDAVAMVWHRLTQPEPYGDVVLEAIFVGRVALEALRCRQLLDGALETAARVVWARAADAPWLGGLREAWDVARELCPPPLARDAAVTRWLEAALACARETLAFANSEAGRPTPGVDVARSSPTPSR